MIQTALKKKSNYNISAYTNNNIGMLTAIFASIIGLTLFQDFLESNRSGYSFYFSEAFLFKSIWIVFIPLLALLTSILKNQNLNSLGKIIFFIITPIFIHLLILAFVFFFFSALFFKGKYDIYKIVTYSLANDLYKLVIIYAVVVFGHRYISYNLTDIASLNKKSYVSKIIIGNGKNNTVIEVNDIYQITAETPYISIQLLEKKYIHTQTLKSISVQLDSDKFIRVHKSTIVNLDKVVSIKSRLNGDYDIHLKNGAEVRLSRTYVANFKNNFKNSYQVSS